MRAIMRRRPVLIGVFVAASAMETLLHAAFADDGSPCYRLVEVDTVFDHPDAEDGRQALSTHAVKREPDGTIVSADNADTPPATATGPGSVWRVSVQECRAAHTGGERATGDLHVTWTPPPETWCPDQDTAFTASATATGAQRGGLRFEIHPRTLLRPGADASVVGANPFAAGVEAGGAKPAKDSGAPAGASGMISVRLKPERVQEFQVSVLLRAFDGSEFQIHYHYAPAGSSPPPRTGIHAGTRAPPAPVEAPDAAPPAVRGPRGRYETRTGDHAKLVAAGGGDPRTVAATRLALQWLARHQNPDGSWGARDFKRQCGRCGRAGACAPNRFDGNPEFDAGLTGLALLAFFGAGVTPASAERAVPGRDDSPTLGQVVKAGLTRLQSIQAADGRIGPDGSRAMYNHAIAALALAEANLMTDSYDFYAPAERALDYLLKARNPGAAWRYAPRSGDNDASVTGWALMALKAAELGGLPFEHRVYEDVRAYYTNVTGTIGSDRLNTRPWGATGAVKAFTVTGYVSRDDAGGSIVIPGQNEAYHYQPSMTAIMLLSRVFIDRMLEGPAAQAVDTVAAFPPLKWDPKKQDTWMGCDFYSWFYGSYALFQAVGPGDARWKAWNAALREALIETQDLAPAHAGKCTEGSWEPVDRWSCEGGRVYATAMNALTLEVYYRYPRVLSASSPRGN